MTPVSSAILMNSPGRSRAPSACRQRTRASAEKTRPVSSCDEGLVVEHELVLRQRLVQPVGDGQPALGGLVQGGHEELVVVASTLLGVVHGGVRGPHQGFPCLPRPRGRG